MKTTDLIPLILYQLVDGDKYGYEIVKQIEDASNGTIIIKQPTLYSLLKKLEQGKFISSYWQDSEIGGKRHYYKLTDNGRAQLDTYPSFEQLLAEVNQDDEIKLSQSTTDNTPTVDTNAVLDVNNEPTVGEPVNIASPVIEDIVKPTLIDLTASVQPIALSADIANEELEKNDVNLDIVDKNDIAIPTELTPNPVVEMVDADNNVVQSPDLINIFDAIEPDEYEDGKFNLENQSPSPTINIEPINIDVNTNLPNEPIVEAQIKSPLYSKLTPNEQLVSVSQNDSVEQETYSPIIQQAEQVKYLNYVDFNTDLTSIKRKKSITRHIQKMILTCATLLIMFVASIVLASKYSFGKLYYVSAIAVCLVIVLYPVLLLKNVPKIRLKYCTTPFRYSMSRDFFIKLSLFLSLIIAIFAYNLTIVSDVKTIFALSNFASFWAPIMFSFGIMLDFVYSMLIYKNYK